MTPLQKQIMRFAFIGAVFIYYLLPMLLKMNGPFHGFISPLPSYYSALRIGLAAFSLFLAIPVFVLAKRSAAPGGDSGFFFIALACGESPAILGLALCLMSGAFITLYLFSALSIFYLAVLFPLAAAF